jgi:quinol monooxygenase YgiN
MWQAFGRTNSVYVVVEFVEAEREHHGSLRQSLMMLGRTLSDKKLGCLHFDVGQDEMDGGSFLLYQVYTTKAAYVAHLELQEYAEHRLLADPWTHTRRHLSYELISGAGIA